MSSGSVYDVLYSQESQLYQRYVDLFGLYVFMRSSKLFAWKLDCLNYSDANIIIVRVSKPLFVLFAIPLYIFDTCSLGLRVQKGYEHISLRCCLRGVAHAIGALLLARSVIRTRHLIQVKYSPI